MRTWRSCSIQPKVRAARGLAVEIAPFLAEVIGEEDEAFHVEALQQHVAGAGLPPAKPSRGPLRSARQSPRNGRLLKPVRELLDRVGGDISLVQGALHIIAPHRGDFGSGRESYRHDFTIMPDSLKNDIGIQVGFGA